MIAPKPKSMSNNDVNSFDIIWAAQNGLNKMVDDLLNSGVDINSNRDGFSVLHIACIQGNAEMAEIFLRHARASGGFDISMRTNDRNLLPWQLALENHHYSLARRVADETRPPSAGLHLVQ